MSELTISVLADFADIIGASTIVTGLALGWYQIRQYRMQQRDAIAMSLAQTFYSRDLAQAIALLQPLPDGIGLDELRARGDAYVEAAVTVATSFETMGLLVFKGIAPLDLVLDLAGGIISTMSRKLDVWQNEMRATQDQPSWGEWFTWLGDQAARRKGAVEPAHIRYRDWKPTRRSL